MNLLLFRSGWVQIALTMVLLLFQLTPPKLFDPQWQLACIAALLANAPSTLLGAVLVCYAARRDDLPSRCLRQAKLLRTCAAWFSLVLLLLVPLQFTAALGIVKTNYLNGMASMRQLGKVVENLSAINNEQQLREQLVKFPDLPELPPKFDKPYQEVRDTIVQTLSERRVATISELAKIRDQTYQVVIKESFRNAATLSLFSFGLIAVSMSDPSQRTIMTSLAMLLEKFHAGNLWFSPPRRRKAPQMNPSWNNDDETKP